MRAFRLALLALVLAGLVAAAVYRSWIAAQARAVVVLSTAIETPVLTWTVKLITDEPRLDEVVVAGAPTTLARPGGSGPWPAIVFLNGATRRGRFHPDVRRLADGLARAGYLVLVPDLPGLRLGEITDRTVASAAGVARAGAARVDVDEGRVALVGVSVGATLALLAAERPPLAGRVSLVAGLAPYTDLRHVIRLATTGTYPLGRRLIRYDADPYVDLAVARSLAAALPEPDRRRLLSILERVDDEADEPLAALAGVQPATRDGRAVVALLENRNPARFDSLYSSLSAELRAGIRRLSPVAGAARLSAPVELVSAPDDKYFPPAESRALARRARDVRVTVTETLSHAIPEPSPGDVVDLFRFDGFVVRVLHGAR